MDLWQVGIVVTVLCQKGSTSEPTNVSEPVTGSTSEPTNVSEPVTGSTSEPTNVSEPVTGSTSGPTTVPLPETGSTSGPTTVPLPETGSTSVPLILPGLTGSTYEPDADYESSGCVVAQTYNGTLSFSKSGRQCQRWDRQKPHKHDRGRSVYFPVDDSVHAAKNYCRDPDDTYELWCYTMDPELRWENCNITVCLPNGSEHIASGKITGMAYLVTGLFVDFFLVRSI